MGETEGRSACRETHNIAATVCNSFLLLNELRQVIGPVKRPQLLSDGYLAPLQK